MISLAGLVGRILDLVVEKVADKKLGDSMSERRKAARAMIAFYDAVSELETLTLEFVDVLRRATTKGRIYARWVAGFDMRVNDATRRFAQQASDLYFVLSVHDPVLGELLGYRFIEEKLGVLIRASQFFRNTGATFGLQWSLPQHRGLESLSISVPPRDLTWFDLNTLYEDLQHGSRRSDVFEALTRMAPYMAEEKDYLRALTNDKLFGVSFGPADIDAINDLLGVLSDHGTVLSAARDRLRAFIASRFTVDELLYVPRSRANE